VLIVGQISAAYLTIYTSSETSDFSISVDTIYYNLYKDTNNNIIEERNIERKSKINKIDAYQRNISSTSANLSNIVLSKIYSLNKFDINQSIIMRQSVTVNDMHQTLKPYPHLVFVNVPDALPKGIEIEFDKPEGTPPFKTEMIIRITNETDVGKYPITIQALGGDGKIRNCKCYIKIGSHIELELLRFLQNVIKLANKTSSIYVFQ